MSKGCYNLSVSEWLKWNKILEYQSIFCGLLSVEHLAPLLAFASEGFQVPKKINLLGQV